MLGPKPKVAAKRHWADVSDERLIDLDLVIDNPEALESLVREVPADHLDAYVEFKYDLRGLDVKEFTCVHGHHQHKAGFVMRAGDVRFMVGWICGKSIYNEDFDQYTDDFNEAVIRQDALRRVRELREAVSLFSAWADQLADTGIIEQFQTVRDGMRQGMPWVFEIIQAARGGRVENVPMPKYLCAEGVFLDEEFERLRSAIAAVTASLKGDAQRIAASIGTVRSDIDGLIRRAEVLLAKLADVELFFQPATLLAISEHAENATPKRKRHFVGIMKLSTRDVCVEMPKGFKLPSRKPIDALQAVASGKE
jgi:hypothetical protein